MKNSFVLYTEHLEQVEMLTDEQSGVLLKALMSYAAGKELPQMDAITAVVFSFMRAQIDKNNKKYEEAVNKRREAGRLGGLAKADNAKQTVANVANATDAKQNVANVADNDYVNDNVNVNDNVKKSVARASRFTPPTEFEIKAYCREKGYSVDAARFIDYYASKGWLVGKNKMKDWKAAVRNWERGQRQESTTKTANRFNNFAQRQYDYDDLEAKLLAQQ